MTFEQAALVLGVKLDGLTREQIADAYRAGIKAAHPDTTGEQGGAAQTIDKLQQARSKLLRYVEQPKAPPCKACGGYGTVRGPVGARTCSVCKGSGHG